MLLMEIYVVYPQIEHASDGNAGRVTEGFYTLRRRWRGHDDQ